MSAPLFFSAPGTGILSSRSDWTPAATQVLLKIGPTRQSHEERAIGAFLIYRGSWLVGTSKLLSKSGLAQDVDAWACLQVDALKQTWTQDQAKIVAQENTPSYTYVKGDVAGAYVGQFSSCTREIFHLLPNYILTRDTYTPVSLSSKVTYHLQTLAQPTIVRSTIVVGQLFGTVINPPSGITTWVPVKLSPDQATPTYRIDLFADTDNEIVVALEAGAANQIASTLGSPLAAAGVKGIVCGSSFVAWLTGPGPWTYKSPVAGTNYLLGLKPNTTYRVPGAVAQSTGAGVLSFPGPAVGTDVIVSESGTPPPPTPPTVTSYGANPVTAGQPFTINGTGFTPDATARFQGLDCAARFLSSIQLSATAPTPVTQQASALLVQQASGSAVGPLLTVIPVPLPPPPGIASYSPNPVIAGQPFTINGANFTPDATASFLGADLKATFVSSTQLSAVAPAPVPPSTSVSSGVTVSQASGRVTGPNLTIFAAPAPPVKAYTVSGTVSTQPDGSLSGAITLTPKPS